MKPNIGISDENREKTIELLSRLLADEYLLYTKTRNYHWNITGDNFQELHKFFESQYGELDGIVDATAERARQLGGRSLGTMKEFLAKTRLEETPGGYPKARRMIADLLADHETVIGHLRRDLDLCAEKYGDAGTSDFLTGLMERHEKMAWMLRAYLE